MSIQEKVKTRGVVDNLEGILEKARKLYDPDMEDFNFSVGEWGKWWIKINFKRKK